MKNIIESPRVRIISIVTILLMMINISFAGDFYPRGSEEKRYEKQSKWSFSLYAAMAFGELGKQFNNQMRVSGFDESYRNFSGRNKYSILSKIRPTSWMIQVDYRMSKVLGTGILYSNSLLGEAIGHRDGLAGFNGIISSRIRVNTISILLSIHLNDYIIFGIGPTFNMTDTPSNVNKLGLLAHLNIRIPLSDYFAVNGIIQYRYIGGTTLEPYYNEASDDYPSTTITTNAQIFPPTELSYNHLFVGLGVGINFKKR